MVDTLSRLAPWLVPGTIVLCWWAEVRAILALGDAQGGIGVLVYTVAYATLLLCVTPVALLAARTCRRAGPQAPAGRFVTLALLACVPVGVGWASVTWRAGAEFVALRRRSLSTEAIRRIADRPAWRYGHERDCLLAVLPNTDPELLRRLAGEPAVAANVAANPKAPLDLLETLAESPDPWVRERLAGNPAWVAARNDDRDADP